MSSFTDFEVQLMADLSRMKLRKEELEQQLTAEREAREKAEAELLAHKEMLRQEMRETNKAHQRAESAEQKLREAQEQKSYKIIKGEVPVWKWAGDTVRLYAAPIPPADVAELQRELKDTEQARDLYIVVGENLQRENAELTRKLAEQQAIWCKIWKMNPHLEKICGCEELTKLLEEAERQAVPEGWQLVPKHSPIVKIELWDGKFWQPEGSANYNRMLAAMIAASPQPLATPEERKE